MGSAQKKLCSMLLSVLLLLDSGCAGNSSVSGDPPDQQAEVPITKSALDGYNKYLQKNLPLAFAIGADGRGYGYMYCDGMHCTPAPRPGQTPSPPATTPTRIVRDTASSLPSAAASRASTTSSTS